MKMLNEFMNDSTETDPSLFTSQCARQYIECEECKKPRVLYSKKSLTRAQTQMLSDSLEETDYTCGSSAIPPEH